MRVRRDAIARIAPGAAFMCAISLAAMALRQLPYISVLSPLILAILIATTFRNAAGAQAWAQAGVEFCLKRVLRLGIMLLGFQLTLSQIGEVGARALGIIVVTTAATFVFTIWAGRMLGVDRKLTQLIAGGTSICGASAVIATNSVTGAGEEDVCYAVACVTVYGSVAMFAYPLLPHLLHLEPQAYGLWSGSSIHEVAQVVAAAFQDGADAGKYGTIAKLCRVMLLAPMVVALSVMAVPPARAAHIEHEAAARKPGPPWFVAGFMLVTAVNSAITVPPEVRSGIVSCTAFLLATALAAMGMQTDLRKLAGKGLRPALLGGVASIFIASLSLALIKALT
ncbi:MAG: YeiH family protein [Rhodospirillaceae bacterium]|nr:YeiH family protein [Rhodospirillaceae bacterium]